MGERGVGVGVAHVGQLDPVGMYVQVPRAAPGIQHAGCDGVGTQRACGQELLSRARGTDGSVDIFDHGGCTSVLNGCIRQLRPARCDVRLNLRLPRRPGADAMSRDRV